MATRIETTITSIMNNNIASPKYINLTLYNIYYKLSFVKKSVYQWLFVHCTIINVTHMDAKISPCGIKENNFKIALSEENLSKV